MNDDHIQLMLMATNVWDRAVADPTCVTPILTLVRKDGQQVSFSLMSHHDSGDLALIRAGIIPLVTPDVATARKRLRPLVSQLDVTGAMFVTQASALRLDRPETARMIVMWTFHRATGSEARWARLIDAEGKASPPIESDEATLVGVDWIKEMVA